MANLVQVAEELEYVPKDQLIQMSQNPESRYPQYLVLSEIQRRTQMEKRYNAEKASMNRPQTTVAEEVVADFAQPQGLAGMNAEGAANAGAFLPEAMPETPMQMAAGGGRTGYREGGTSYGREWLLSTFGIKTEGKTKEQVDEELRFAQNNQVVTEDIQTIDTGLGNKVDLDPVPVSSKGDVPTINDSTSQFGVLPPEDNRIQVDWGGLGSSIKDRYTDEGEGIGAVDWSNVGHDLGQAAMFGIPGGAAVRGLYGMYKLGRAGQAARKTKDLASRFGSWATRRPVPRVTAKGGKKGTFDAASPQGQAILRGKNPPKIRPSTTRTEWSGPRISALGAVGGGGLSGLSNYLSSSDEEATTQAKEDITSSLDAHQAGKEPTSNKGLSGKVNNFLDQADGLDIAKLGGIVMGAKNMSELGQGITALASDIQDRRKDAKTEDRLVALSGVQSDLYQAQAREIEAKVESMPIDSLVEELGAASKAYRIVAEQSTDATELSGWVTYLNALQGRLSRLRGGDSYTPDDSPYDAPGVSVSN